jgi:intracellular multiplication protein IcmF
MSFNKSLSHAIKKVIEHFPDQNKGISLLIASSPHAQGSTTVLKQSTLQHINIEQEPNLHLYYNQQGIILEINQQWHEHANLNLSQLFKKINRIHRRLKISGFLFFIDICDLLHQEHAQQDKDIKKHIQHIDCLLDTLDYSVRSALVITKLDQITGFTDFYSNCHDKELEEPLGFSLAYTGKHPKFKALFTETWSNFVSSLNHSMIQKIHTTRANKKRILIREFPLQIAVLENRFFQMIKNISHHRAHIHGIYFTCAEQKGKNLNYLNHKIQNNFALTVSIQSIQSVNFRPFFIPGALKHCLEISSYFPKPTQIQDPKNLKF